MITIDDFAKIELRVVSIIHAERVEGSDKLIQLKVNDGTEEPRQIVAGIGKTYAPEELIGQRIVVVANLEPRMLMGIESRGMVLAAKDNEGRLSLITSLDEVSPGASLS